MVEILLDHLNSGYMHSKYPVKCLPRQMLHVELLGGVYIQYHPMDARQVFELRVSSLGSFLWMVYRSNFYVVHSWLYGLDLVYNSGRSRNGKNDARSV